MAKITIEELYRREKYDIMGAVTAKALALGINERTDDGRTWIEMELVRQTIIAMLKLNKTVTVYPTMNSVTRSPFLMRTRSSKKRIMLTAILVSWR